MPATAERSSRPTPRVRKPESARIASKLRIGATLAYARWLGCFMRHTGQVEIAATFREGLRLWAESSGFPPPPRR